MSQTSTSVKQAADRPRPWWRRPRILVPLIVGLLVTWFLVTLALTAFHGYRTYSAAKATASALTSGDALAAQENIATAQSNARSAQANISGLPLGLLRVIPWVNTNLTATQDVLSAGVDLLDGVAVVTEHSGSGPLLEGTRINVEALTGIAPHAAEISDHVTQARTALSRVPTDATRQLREISVTGTAQLETAQRALRLFESVGPDLPKLLGADEPQTYLVVFNNPAELYAGGGASLNVALVRLTDGQFEVVGKGAVSRNFFPGNPRVPWNPVAAGPYYATEDAQDGFAWSNLHQDFRISGEDMLRSWKANGGKHVDGVISLDPLALAEAVRATGPIQSPLYGEITADNLIEKLFFEGYNEDPVAQAERQRINQQLIDEMLSRLQSSGTQAATISSAMLSTSPGQHLRIYLSDGRHAKALHEAGLDGAQPDAQPDRIAFYTQNQNSSKVDIFQTRSVVHDVQLNADGSAEVTQTATVTNNAPAEGGSPLNDRIGYTTRWAFHWNIALLPRNARGFAISAESDGIKRDDRVFTDVDGRKAIRVGGWIPPGESSVITVTYRLPAGTFGDNGNLEYRASVEHQLLVNDVDLAVNVSGPSTPTPLEGTWTVDGNTASTRFAVTQPATIAVRFGDPA